MRSVFDAIQYTFVHMPFDMNINYMMMHLDTGPLLSDFLLHRLYVFSCCFFLVVVVVQPGRQVGA